MRRLAMKLVLLLAALSFVYTHTTERQIDPQTKIFLNTFCSQDSNLADISLEEFRADDQLFEPEKSLPVSNIKDISIAGDHGPFSLRIYHPEKSEELLPIVLFLHGGGWVWGNLNSHDGFCRELCTRARIIVVGVDYHRAPECKFPAAINDCYTAALWIARHGVEWGGDITRVGIMGDSAVASRSSGLLYGKRSWGAAIALPNSTISGA